MSIKGIRKLKDGNQSVSPLYQSQQLPNTVQIKKIKHFELHRLNHSRDLNFNQSFMINQQSGSQTDRKNHQKNLFSRKKEYQNFLENQMQLDIVMQKNKRYRISIKSKQTNSFSTKQRRRDRSGEKTQSRLSNYIIKQTNYQKINSINKSFFKIEFVVGKGGFGKVWKVKQKKTGNIFAMKEMSKTKVINKRSINSVMNQKKLLQKLHHPFIVNMKCSFQDQYNLYLVMDYVNGGDLRYHLCNKKKFTQNQTKFFVCCIILGLQYLHSNKIIHRDLKPQNLVLDQKGYLKITDLGVSKQWRLNNGSDTSGTPGYMSPEVICKGDHTFTTDFFALGVIVYEFMLGKRPYLGRNRQQIRQQILAKQVKIQQTPSGWSNQSIDFVNKLIQRKPQNRLGNNGINSLKNHGWLKGYNWKGLQKRGIKSPFIPLTIEQDYVNYQECISSDTILQDQQQYNLLLKCKETQQLFEGYEFNIQKGGVIQKNLLKLQDLDDVQKGEKKYKKLIGVK